MKNVSWEENEEDRLECLMKENDLSYMHRVVKSSKRWKLETADKRHVPASETSKLGA